MPIVDQTFTQELMSIGIVSYREHETLWNVGQRCARTTGIPLAGAGALMGSQAGTVTLPVVGTVSGAAAGALVGLVSGTASCMMLNYSVREELRALARGESP